MNTASLFLRSRLLRRALDESGYPLQLEREQINHGDLVAALERAELCGEFGLVMWEDKEDANRMDKARIELPDLPHGQILLQRILETNRCP